MYHRILPASDPRYAAEEPGMVVTPETFRDHLQTLSEFFEFVHLGEWQRRAKAGQALPTKACAITFDDGWSDNYQYALPILQATSTPATLFAVAQMIGTRRQFWPNRINELLRHHVDEVRSLPDTQWLGITSAEPPDRERIAQVIHACKQMSDDEVEARLDELESAVGIDTGGEPALMDWRQLGEMANTGLVEIGSHTCSHRRLLPSLDEMTLHHEIVDSKHILETKLERPVSSFCYPNGDYSPAAANLVAQHYDLAVTTRRGLNNIASNVHQLNRIGLHEDVSNSRSQLLARLSALR
jgi:peptidoglycan/xylan/chitin deacetylase (PgdA/CDA1 family)